MLQRVEAFYLAARYAAQDHLAYFVAGGDQKFGQDLTVFRWPSVQVHAHGLHGDARQPAQQYILQAGALVALQIGRAQTVEQARTQHLLQPEVAVDVFTAAIPERDLRLVKVLGQQWQQLIEAGGELLGRYSRLPLDAVAGAIHAGKIQRPRIEHGLQHDIQQRPCRTMRRKQQQRLGRLQLRPTAGDRRVARLDQLHNLLVDHLAQSRAVGEHGLDTGANVHLLGGWATHGRNAWCVERHKGGRSGVCHDECPLVEERAPCLCPSPPRC
ncbi:MAG TPA: hypothetical protein VES70_09575 [Pseudomonas sp.]|nr:hypothetical protein [Pseudomonas sp.]